VRIWTPFRVATLTNASLPSPPPANNAEYVDCVDERVLEERAEYEDEADDHPDVDRLDVRHAWECLVDAPGDVGQL